MRRNTQYPPLPGDRAVLSLLAFFKDNRKELGIWGSRYTIQASCRSPAFAPTPISVSSSEGYADNRQKGGAECLQSTRSKGPRAEGPMDLDPSNYPTSCHQPWGHLWAGQGWACLWGHLPTCEPGRRGWVPRLVRHSCRETGVTESPSSPGPLGPALHPRGCLTSWR